MFALSKLSRPRVTHDFSPITKMFPHGIVKDNHLRRRVMPIKKRRCSHLDDETSSNAGGVPRAGREFGGV